MEKQNNIFSKKNYKHYKLIYNISKINKNLNNNNFFIFYYNILNKTQKNLIKKTLNETNFELINIKKSSILKNFQENSNLLNLKNYLTNNTMFLIFQENKNYFNVNIFNNLKNLKFLTLIGFWYKKKLYRKNEIEKWIPLTISIKQEVYFILKLFFFKLRFFLTFKKI